MKDKPKYNIGDYVYIATKKENEMVIVKVLITGCKATLYVNPGGRKYRLGEFYYTMRSLDKDYFISWCGTFNEYEGFIYKDVDELKNTILKSCDEFEKITASAGEL